jgi:hypothetical protein
LSEEQRFRRTAERPVVSDLEKGFELGEFQSWLSFRGRDILPFT